MDIDLHQIIDIPKFQELTDAFYQATGIPSAILNTRGDILTRSGWQDACTQFHRKHPEASNACRTNKDRLCEERTTILSGC
jgi:ligand-binding sensor protein